MCSSTIKHNVKATRIGLFERVPMYTISQNQTFIKFPPFFSPILLSTLMSTTHETNMYPAPSLPKDFLLKWNRLDDESYAVFHIMHIKCVCCAVTFLHYVLDSCSRTLFYTISHFQFNIPIVIKRRRKKRNLRCWHCHYTPMYILIQWHDKDVHWGKFIDY